MPKYVHDPDKKFNEILVPTVDTVRNTWLLEQMIKIKHPILFVGDTGTSKTATIQDFLRNIDQESHVSKLILKCYYLPLPVISFSIVFHYEIRVYVLIRPTKSTVSWYQRSQKKIRVAEKKSTREKKKNGFSMHFISFKDYLSNMNYNLHLF